jgi:TRAP-type C4-dicarboxylate transport system substrate-binding protein
MKRKIVLQVVICLVVGMCVITVIGLTQQPSTSEKEIRLRPIVFRLAETEQANHPSAMASEYFASLVNKRSNGKIKIKVYYNEELGNPKEILEQVQFGGITMARVNVLDLTEMVPSLQPYFEPQAYTDTDMLMDWVRENNEVLSNSCQVERFILLGWYYPDIRCFYSDEEAVHKVSDLDQMRISTTESEIITNTMKIFGSTAIESKTIDTYKSLSSGYIDVGETTLSQLVLSDNYNFINYITLSQYIVCPDVMLMSKVDYNKLEKSDRDLISQCQQETYKYQKNLLEEFQNSWIVALEKEKQLFVEDETFKSQMNNMLRKEMVDMSSD